MGRAANTIETNDTFRSADGVLKQRWPNELAAWYVAELCLLGKHGRTTAGKKLYAYRCIACHGWHLASCKTRDDRRLHRRGIEAMQRQLDTKIPQIAGKNKGML